MAKFDVHQRVGARELLLVCQADLFGHLPTRFVVPLVPVGDLPMVLPHLNPVFDLGDDRYVMATQLALAVSASELGRYRASLSRFEYEIGRALDVLIGGV